MLIEQCVLGFAHKSMAKALDGLRTDVSDESSHRTREADREKETERESERAR